MDDKWIKLIPAIDLIDGKCVRLTKGDYGQVKTYGEHPVEVAKHFADMGFKRLHVVDLDGAKVGHMVNIKVVGEIVHETNLVVDLGGGIQSDDDIRRAFDNGVEMVTIGSVAVKCRELFLDWLHHFGAEHIILGADVRNGQIAINGSQENSAISLLPFLSTYIDEGIKYVLCTDISKDGMLEGPAFDLYKEILEIFPQLQLIASGGISSIADIRKLEQMGVSEVVFGKAIYEGILDLKQLLA